MSNPDDLKSKFELKKVIGGDVESLFEGYSTPRINVKECKTHILIEVELPGVPKQNIELDIEPTFIEIRAHTSKDDILFGVHPLEYIRKERPSGKFKRTIELPCKININDTSASYHEGVLYIEIEKPDDSVGKGKRQIKLK